MFCKYKTETIIFGTKKERDDVSTKLKSLMFNTSNNVRNLCIDLDSDQN